MQSLCLLSKLNEGSTLQNPVLRPRELSNENIGKRPLVYPILNNVPLNRECVILNVCMGQRLYCN